MTIFSDTDQFYQAARALFARLQEGNPDVAKGIEAARMVLRLAFTNPDAEFTINGRQRPADVTFGPSRLRPTMDIKMEADTLHRIMLDELSLKSALAQGAFQVRGPVWKLGALADLFYHMQALYPEILRDQGIQGG